MPDNNVPAVNKGRRRRRPTKEVAPSTPTSSNAKKILLLHGNRQTGQLLLGRIEKLQKRLSKELQIEVIAPDAPLKVDVGTTDGDSEDTCSKDHDHSLHLTWWNRIENDYQGLDKTLELLGSPDWNNDQIVGIMGFSQGARLCHLLAQLRQDELERDHMQQHKGTLQTGPSWFPNLRFLIMVAGYDAPLPDRHMHLSSPDSKKKSLPLDIPSLHVWGLADPLIAAADSEKVTEQYHKPKSYVHPGKHFVPTKGPDIQAYLDFIRDAMAVEDHQRKQEVIAPPSTIPNLQSVIKVPDEDSAIMQQDEVQALEAIFPDEIKIQSSIHEVDGEVQFDFPIVYLVKLLPNDDGDRSNTKWPIHPLTLEVRYPYDYPLDSIPNFRLLHENNNYEFPSNRLDQVMHILKETSHMELGMPSVLSGIYATKEYLDAPPSAEEEHTHNPLLRNAAPNQGADADDGWQESITARENTDNVPPVVSLVSVSSPERIQVCNLEGLEIAERILKDTVHKRSVPSTSTKKSGSGGSTWNYVIGLVGKPSAGKSTFFNAATAFSRQRGSGEETTAASAEYDSEWGGASMAAHPFTTIDPNIGYCLIPAPFGACPEDATGESAKYGSTHGRAPDGRRFLPVLLKDVAGLVPGAYQGRGRGNQFLNDLTDATVLVHVVDASGTADAQGNKTVTDADADADDETSALTNPLDDLAWIRNELVEWVYSNVTAKWDTIRRKGRTKLSGMFSGYGGLRDAETQNILNKVEQYLEEEYQRDHALEALDTWDQADIHRLVSAFLGVRFPMALALNKCDLSSSQGYVKEILNLLPIHGAHAGTPMTAQDEMMFVRNHLKSTRTTPVATPAVTKGTTISSPTNVWNCLTSAMTLREPVLVFPVSDMVTCAPLPGLNRGAAESASLPSAGMIRCIEASGGSLPSCWNPSQQCYAVPTKDKSSHQILRDVLVMKPGSTVEDVFTLLKKLGALGGDFVRAEAKGNLGDQGKPIPKLEVMGRNNRIIKIMSNKRTAWQS